jgi:hypothetical protein
MKIITSNQKPLYIVSILSSSLSYFFIFMTIITYVRVLIYSAKLAIAAKTKKNDEK